MLAAMHLASIDDLADVEPVLSRWASDPTPKRMAPLLLTVKLVVESALALVLLLVPTWVQWPQRGRISVLRKAGTKFLKLARS